MKNRKKTISEDNNNIAMLREFIKEIKSSMDATDTLIDSLTKDNNKNEVQKLFEVFHTIKGLSEFLNLEVLSGIAEEVEILLDIVYKQNIAQNSTICKTFYEIREFFISSCLILDEKNSDKSLNKKADKIICKIKDTTEKITIIKIDLGEFSSEIVTVDYSSQEESSVPPSVETFKNESSLEKDTNEEWAERFVSETFDTLSIAENNFMAIEKDSNNKEIISSNFRIFHTLKASAGMFGFGEIEKVAVEVETVLDDAREKRNPLTKELVHVMLKKIDLIREGINKIGAAANKSLSLENKTKVAKNLENKPPQTNILNQIQSEKNNKPKHEESAQPKDIRVDMMKLDKLFDLVGELITAEVMISSNPAVKKIKDANLNKAVEFLDRITRDLQETTLSIRMTPMEDLFNKMKRLVHDLSFKFDKEIDLEISGQETEMDKKVIEELADPLVHILRNAIDHGIENKEERSSKNKNETGKISLSARYEGNEILVIIKDDGRGLNREKIIKKASSRGLLKSPAESLKDEEVWNFIFEPGFSTAEVVTEVSGRGVGMDVVRRNLEKIKGRVEITSEYERGSSFILRIPLTLAIMDGIIVKVGDTLYSIPILSICESFRPKKVDISKTMDGLEMVKIREEILPVVRLHEMFNKTTEITDLDRGTLVIVESKAKKSCLFVDSILDEQQVVVKGLSDYIGKVDGVTGCMILGDGSVGLILDIEDIVRRSERININLMGMN